MISSISGTSPLPLPFADEPPFCCCTSLLAVSVDDMSRLWFYLGVMGKEGTLSSVCGVFVVCVGVLWCCRDNRFCRDSIGPNIRQRILCA